MTAASSALTFFAMRSSPTTARTAASTMGTRELPPMRMTDSTSDCAQRGQLRKAVNEETTHDGEVRIPERILDGLDEAREELGALALELLARDGRLEVDIVNESLDLLTFVSFPSPFCNPEPKLTLAILATFALRTCLTLPASLSSLAIALASPPTFLPSLFSKSSCRISRITRSKTSPPTPVSNPTPWTTSEVTFLSSGLGARLRGSGRRADLRETRVVVRDPAPKS